MPAEAAPRRPLLFIKTRFVVKVALKIIAAFKHFIRQQVRRSMADEARFSGELLQLVGRLLGRACSVALRVQCREVKFYHFSE